MYLIKSFTAPTKIVSYVYLTTVIFNSDFFISGKSKFIIEQLSKSANVYVFELIFVNRSLAITQNIKFQAITCYEVLKGFIFKIGNICRTKYLLK